MDGIKVTDVRYLKGDSAFLIDDGKTAILYDTGFGFTGDKVADNIKEVLKDRKLDYIFLTHSHYDHALGSAVVNRRFPGVKVVAGKYAASVFAREGAKKVMERLDREFALANGVAEYIFPGDTLRVDIAVADGDIIKAGDMTFSVMDLPGHTKCSVGYYCKEKKLLLSTETLGVYDGDKNIVPSYLVGYNMALNSMKIVLCTDIKYMLAPHLGILTEKQTEFFLVNMIKANTEAAEFIVKKIKTGMSDEDVMNAFFDRYIYGYMSEIYPPEAAKLNTSIMIELLKKELL